MLFRKLSGLWGQGVQRWIRTQHKRNASLATLLLAKAPSKPPPRSRRARSVAVASSALFPSGPASRIPPRHTGSAQRTGQWLKFSHPLNVLESGRPGASMNYWLYLPNTPNATRLPLVVMLHGCAQTARQFAQSTRMNQLADKKGFAVLYPEQTASSNAGRCWRWYRKEVREGEAEVKSVVAIIQKVVEQYALDRSRIYVAGISAGAAMAQIIAINHPHLIAAVGMHSGAVFGVASTPMEGYSVMQNGAVDNLRQAIREAAARQVYLPVMPAFLIHGHQDSIVRSINLAHLAEQFRELHHLAGYARENMLVKITEKLANQRSGRPYKIYEYYCGKKKLLQVCEVDELGHAWSGGDDAVNFSDSQGPDASRMMWEFFSRHQRVLSAQETCLAEAARLNGTRGD